MRPLEDFKKVLLEIETFEECDKEYFEDWAEYLFNFRQSEIEELKSQIEILKEKADKYDDLCR